MCRNLFGTPKAKKDENGRTQLTAHTYWPRAAVNPVPVADRDRWRLSPNVSRYFRRRFGLNRLLPTKPGGRPKRPRGGAGLGDDNTQNPGVHCKRMGELSATRTCPRSLIL